MTKEAPDLEVDPPAAVSVAPADQSAFYTQLFTSAPKWSSAAPNEDEAARWARIEPLVKAIVTGSQICDRATFRILEVGCGRGWLTQLLSAYGVAEGVEPVAPVVEHARKLFPQLRFEAGDAESVLNRPDFSPYDLAVSSEVIEHVPEPAKQAFVASLARLLKPGGHALITTPRGEVLREWTRLMGDPSQPVEDWMTEAMLERLFAGQGFRTVARERVWFDTTRRMFAESPDESGDTLTSSLIAIYQVWAFRTLELRAPVDSVPARNPEAILSEFHTVCRDAAERALQALPDHPMLLTARAAALFDLGQASRAARAAARAAALHADHAPARRLLAAVLRVLGQAEDAEIQDLRAAELEATVASEKARTFSFLQRLHEGRFVEGQPRQLEVRHATIEHQAGPCIYLHPPAQLRFRIPTAEPGRFTCAIAIQPEAWHQPNAGGCAFSLTLDGREIFRKDINPTRSPADRCWHEVALPIKAAPSGAHEFVFRTQALGFPADFRWALWRQPVFTWHPAGQREPRR